MKKLISLALVMLMVLVLNTAVMADTVTPDTAYFGGSTTSKDCDLKIAFQYKAEESNEAVYGADITWYVDAGGSVNLIQEKKWDPETKTYTASGNYNLDTASTTFVIQIVNASNKDAKFTVKYTAESNNYFSSSAKLNDVDVTTSASSDIELSKYATTTDKEGDEVPTAACTYEKNLVISYTKSETVANYGDLMAEANAAFKVGKITITIAPKTTSPS